MRPHYSIVTSAVSEPLTLDQATEHVRIDSSDDLQYLESLIEVAREYVNSVTGRVSIQTTFKLVAGSWADLGMKYPSLSFTVMRFPLISVTSVKYYAPDAVTQTTLDTDEYRVITTTEPGLIQIIDTVPVVDDRPDAIEITLVAGYSDGCNAPAILKHAQKLMVAHLYENRLPAAFASVSEIPYTLQTLLENQKIGGRIA